MANLFSGSLYNFLCEHVKPYIAHAARHRVDKAAFFQPPFIAGLHGNNHDKKRQKRFTKKW